MDRIMEIISNVNGYALAVIPMAIAIMLFRIGRKVVLLIIAQQKKTNDEREEREENNREDSW